VSRENGAPVSPMWSERPSRASTRVPRLSEARRSHSREIWSAPSKGPAICRPTVATSMVTGLSAVRREDGHQYFLALPYECSVAALYWSTLPELFEVIPLGEQGKLRPQVEYFPLARTGGVHELRAGKARGRAVIVPSEAPERRQEQSVHIA
jgi:hypothetical protein